MVNRDRQARQLSLERLARPSRTLAMSGRNEEPGSVSGSRGFVPGGRPAYRGGQAGLLVDVAIPQLQHHPSRQTTTATTAITTAAATAVATTAKEAQLLNRVYYPAGCSTQPNTQKKHARGGQYPTRCAGGAIFPLTYPPARVLSQRTPQQRGWHASYQVCTVKLCHRAHGFCIRDQTWTGTHGVKSTILFWALKEFRCGTLRHSGH